MSATGITSRRPVITDSHQRLARRIVTAKMPSEIVEEISRA
jgi:hypothetical protein